MSPAKVRVTGQLLQNFQQNTVCILGTPVKISSNSQELVLKTTDDATVSVELREPLQEHLDGYIEVCGQYNGRQIMSATYIAFPSELTANFDAEAYNQAVQLFHKNMNN